jgi:hypothetical protein
LVIFIPISGIELVGFIVIAYPTCLVAGIIAQILTIYKEDDEWVNYIELFTVGCTLSFMKLYGATLDFIDLPISTI